MEILRNRTKTTGSVLIPYAHRGWWRRGQGDRHLSLPGALWRDGQCDLLGVIHLLMTFPKWQWRRHTRRGKGEEIRVSSMGSAQCVSPRMLELGFAEMSYPEKEFSPAKRSRSPTVAHFPWEPGVICSTQLSLFLCLYLFCLSCHGNSTFRNFSVSLKLIFTIDLLIYLLLKTTSPLGSKIQIFFFPNCEKIFLKCTLHLFCYWCVSRDSSRWPWLKPSFPGEIFSPFLPPHVEFSVWKKVLG